MRARFFFVTEIQRLNQVNVIGMKLIFAYDHHFIPHDGMVFSEGQFTEVFWDRYLTHFSEILVVCRHGEYVKEKNVQRITRSDRFEVKFEFLPNLSSLRGQLSLRPHAATQLHNILRGADALVARLPSEIGLLAVAEAQRIGLPWAVEIVGCAWDSLWNYGSFQAKCYAPFMAWRTKQAVRKAEFALYVTSEFLQKRYPCKDGARTVACSNVSISNDSDAILDTKLKSITSQSLPLVLGLIGTLRTRYKGIQTVLKALSLARSSLPPVIFRVLGGGDPFPWQVEATRLGVSDITFFDDPLPPGDAVLEWLDGVDLYLQPSFQEGLPRALIEAMSRACPALASHCGGIPELLEKGCLIQPGDSDCLSRLIILALSDEHWRISQARRNWKTSQHYTFDSIDDRRRVFFSEFACCSARISSRS